jgi:enoyl-CoA hydratase
MTKKEEWVKVKDYQLYIYEKKGQMARVTINKPHKFNAIFFMEPGSIDMIELNEIMDDVIHDHNLKVMILAGAGKNFCVGEELVVVGEQYGKEFATTAGAKKSAQKTLQVDREAFSFLNKILWNPRITIAQVRGRAMGVGSDFVLCCDLAIASENGSIGFAEESLAFGGMGFPMRIAALGPKRWKELAYTARRLEALEAKEWGVFNAVVPDDKLEDEVERWAQACCLMPAEAIAYGKAASQLSLYAMGWGGLTDYIGITHAMGTNIHFSPGEWNLFKERRDKGFRQAIHERNKRYEDLGFKV